METAKIVVVVGLLASAVAVGLSFLMSSFSGSTVSGDEIARSVIISFVVTGSVLVALRRRVKS